MAEEFDIVSGEFEGNFFTHQKSALTAAEWNSAKKDHAIHLYRGELKNIKKEHDYRPEEFRNRESLLLNNVTNVQFHLSNKIGQNTSKIFDFEQLLLLDAEIKETWELNGKTYGIVCGKLIGKVRKRISNFDPTNPPPKNTTEIPKITPDDRNNNPQPLRHEILDFVQRSGGCLSGCLSNVWRLFLALLLLLLLLLLLWFLKGCLRDFQGKKDCCDERDRLEQENREMKKYLDSLNIRLAKITDSLKHTDIQEEINDITSKVYFKGNTADILKYSERQLDQIVSLVKRSKHFELEVHGYVNGFSTMHENLDLQRAETVKELLIQKGINPNYISAKGMGQSFTDKQDYYKEIDVDGDKVLWNKNMRVEIVVIKF